MREQLGPSLKAAGWTAFLAGLAILLLNIPDLTGATGLLAILIGAVIVMGATAIAVVLLSGDQMPEQDFERLVERSETLARMPAPDREPDEFDELVREAIDELPDEFQELLKQAPVIVADHGSTVHAYGQYIGDTVARDNYPDRIVIYRDTLEREFGHDPELLRAQVQRTVRHELAHHLGWNESGVLSLGL